MSEQRIINLAEIPLTDLGDGKDFVARIGKAGPIIGSLELGCTLTVLPPGKRAYPFHRHHVNHELFYVLEGRGEVRIGDETKPIRAGDLIAAPAGAEPHQIVNSSDAELRYLALSTVGSVDVLEYPDSGKIAAAAGIKNADFKTATITVMGHVQPAGYYDGETPKR